MTEAASSNLDVVATPPDLFHISPGSVEQPDIYGARLVGASMVSPSDSAFTVQHPDPFSDAAADNPPDDGAGKRPAGLHRKPSSIAGSDMASTSSSKELAKGDDKSDKKDDKPAWSELKTKAGKERKRLPLACIACRRKKIRCSGEKPACKHCLRSRIPCVYKVTTRKAAPRTDYMTMLDKRLKRMEERVIKIIPTPDTAKMASIGRASVKPPAVQAPRSSGKKRGADEVFGCETEQWPEPIKAEPVQHTALLEPSGVQLQTDGAEHLPSKDIQEHLVEVYFDCCYGQAYPLLHKPSFQRRLQAGVVPPVLILAICALSARFSNHPQINSEPAFLRGEQWAKPAREIVLKHYDEPNITILITLMLLGLHEFGTCQGGRSWMFAGMALRMAFSLQLHRELDNDPLGKRKDKTTEQTFTDREIRRRAMWGCFMMDRFMSSGTDRPMMLDERDIEIQLPVSEFNFYHETPGITETLDGSVTSASIAEEAVTLNAKQNMGAVAYVVRVIAIWGRVIRYVNFWGKKKDPHPIWSSASQFAELKRQAEDFRHNLPDHLKYTAENLRVHKTEGIANHFLLLHVALQEIFLFMHKFAIPMHPNAAPPSDMPAEFVKMSGRAALEAAGRISEILSEGSTNSLMAPFTGYCAFLSSTVHVWGVFSKNPTLEAASKRHLATNVKFLSQHKKYWGLMYHMSDNLRTIYRQFADAATRKAGGDDDKSAAAAAAEPDTSVLEYGGWFATFPHGVSHTDYQEPAPSERNSTATDGALSQRSDLQTVEEFFDTLQRPVLPQRRKQQRRQGPAAEPVLQQPQPQHIQQKQAQSQQSPQQQPAPPQHSPQRRRTGDSTSSRVLSSNIQVDTSWSPPGGMGVQAHSPYSAPGPLFPMSPQQAQQVQQQQQQHHHHHHHHHQQPSHQHGTFRRPSHPSQHPGGARGTPRSVHPGGRSHRASFDAAFSSNQRLQAAAVAAVAAVATSPQNGTNPATAGLDAYTAGLYSPPQQQHAHAPQAYSANSMGAAGGGFAPPAFFAAGGVDGGGAGDVFGLGVSVPELDRQRVFGAHATDPGVAMDVWDFDGLAQQAAGTPGAPASNGQPPGDDQPVDATPEGMTGVDLAGAPLDADPHGDHAAAAAAAAAAARADGSAWWMPFNLLPSDVLREGFAADFGPAGDAPDREAEEDL